MVEAAALTQCPQCGCARLFKDGLRYLADGSSVQRWLCRECGYRFSEASTYTRGKGLNTVFRENRNRQISALLEDAKNLDTATETKTVAGEPQQFDAKGKILSYLFHMKKQGLSETTITNTNNKLTQLSKLCNINDPEAVKEALSKKAIKPNSKAAYVVAYNGFLKWQGKTWEAPRYQFVQPIPFIPLECEIDALIAGTGKTTSAVLLLLKETGMRIGEALRLEWTDINTENNTITLNKTEKHGRPRMFKVSARLIGVLEALPKKSEKVFGGADVRNKIRLLKQQRTFLAKKLNNPRLEKITYHTIRHWKGTMEYHKTHDPDHVKRLLGHRNLQSTEIYINMEQACFSESDQQYHVKLAKTIDEACKLLEVGFEFVCDMDGAKLFRKRK
ncbi:MAG: tyrosine-type recombinase/integrase [Candidatus Bathyarchaeota archaeon]|nr:tyrosine-type recombinase/integrase [Candidatus Bathyarchaeota archaeon]